MGTQDPRGAPSESTNPNRHSFEDQSPRVHHEEFYIGLMKTKPISGFHDFALAPEFHEFIQFDHARPLDAFIPQDTLGTRINADLAYAINHPLQRESDHIIFAWLMLEHHLHQSPIEWVTSLWRLFEDKKVAALQLLGDVNAIDLPIRLMISQHDYILSKILGQGRFGMVFQAFSAQNPSVPLVIKISLKTRNPKMVFARELEALKRVHRLISFDPEHLILVQSMVPGKSLADIMEDELDPTYIQSLKEQYDQLSPRFFAHTGLVHNDIRPANVIVDDQGVMHLIDFGDTDMLSSTKPISEQLQKDLLKSQVEFSFSLETVNVKKALEHPQSASSRAIVIDFVRRLKGTRRTRLVDLWIQNYEAVFQDPFPKQLLLKEDQKIRMMQSRVQHDLEAVDTPRVTLNDFNVLISALRNARREVEAFKWEALRDRLHL